MLTAPEFARLHSLTISRVRQLCRAGSLAGATKIGRDWLIPEIARRPIDRRKKPPAAAEIPRRVKKKSPCEQQLDRGKSAGQEERYPARPRRP